MKLGMLTSILSEQTFKEVIDIASQLGFRSIEAASWPQERAERRYAGVSHVNVSGMDESKAKFYKDYCSEHDVEIAALAYYPNYLDHNQEKRQKKIQHLLQVIDVAVLLDCNTVTTFIGRDHTKNIEENFELFMDIWPSVIQYAEKKQVRIAIENCPMLFDETQWPGGQNLAISPQIWRRMFRAIPSRFFGLCYDPSHFIWQQMDYIRPLDEFREKIFHVHCKDIKVNRDKLNDKGILAYPLEYMSPKLPGLGDVNWAGFISKLTDIGYNENVCVEIEDKAFESGKEDIIKSLTLSKRYLEQFVI